MSTPSIDLPEEVIELIFSKSPFKSVARFKSVSKSWQSIISTPRFSQIHRVQQPEIPNRFLIWTPWEVRRKYYVIIRLEEKKFLTESALDNPFEAKPGKPAVGYRYQTLDYSNGLFLLGTHNVGNYDYVLWNPSMRKHITIRALSLETHPHAFRACLHSLSDNPILCHLYHDPATDDHKIVLVYDDRFSVYSCNNGSWSEMKDFTCDLSLIDIDRKVCADGCFYIIYDDEIECFDFRDGKLHKLRPPLAVNSRTKLREVSGRLCFYEMCVGVSKCGWWRRRMGASRIVGGS